MNRYEFSLFKESDQLTPDTIVFLPQQQKVINAWAKGADKIFFEGAIRAGKSICFSYIIDFICSHTIGMEFYIYRDTFESIKKDTHRIFQDHPGFAQGKGVMKDNGKRMYYPSTNSNIFFQHTKGGKHTLGQTAGGIFFEQLESMAEDDFDLIVPRLSQWGPKAIEDYKHKYDKYIREGKLLVPQNYLFMSANPRAGWIKSRYIDTDGIPDLQLDINGKPINVFKPMPVDRVIVQDKLKLEGIKRVSTSVYDNLANLGPAYANLVRTSSNAFKKQYFDGDWTLNTGLIYQEFNPQNIEDGGNVVGKEWEESNKFNPKNLKSITAIDPGYVKSKFVALLTTILTDGTIYCYDEVVKNGKGVETWEKVGPNEFAKELNDKYKEWGLIKAELTIIDSAAHNENAGLGSVSGQLAKHGINAISARKSGEYGSIMGIKDLFKAKKILVNARCQHTIRELGLFRWDERKVISGDQKPLDEDNDIMDALRYIYAATPRAKVINQPYEEKFNKAFEPQNQYSNWMSQWKVKKKKSNRTNLDYGV